MKQTERFVASLSNYAFETLSDMCRYTKNSYWVVDSKVLSDELDREPRTEVFRCKL